MKSFARVSGVLVLSLFCFVLWFVIASDYSDKVVSGRYQLVQNCETSTLILKPDHSFHQELTRQGKTEHAEGSWRLFGEGHIAISKEFLRVSGQEPGPDGTAYGDIHKTLGFFVSLRLSQYHVLWYGRGDPSNGDPVSGTYSGDEPGVPATLVLKPDRTFEQTVTNLGIAKHAVGSWSFNRAGDISFSKAFLKTSGEPLRADETASAWNPKGSNLQIEIAVTSKSGEPTFRKRLLP
jgi:hypothetical protein